MDETVSAGLVPGCVNPSGAPGPTGAGNGYTSLESRGFAAYESSPGSAASPGDSSRPGAGDPDKPGPPGSPPGQRSKPGPGTNPPAPRANRPAPSIWHRSPRAVLPFDR